MIVLNKCLPLSISLLFCFSIKRAGTLKQQCVFFALCFLIDLILFFRKPHFAVCQLCSCFADIMLQFFHKNLRQSLTHVKNSVALSLGRSDDVIRPLWRHQRAVVASPNGYYHFVNRAQRQSRDYRACFEMSWFGSPCCICRAAYLMQRYNNL